MENNGDIEHIASSSEIRYTTYEFSSSKTSTKEEDLEAKLKNLDIQKILRSVIGDQDEETVKHEISSEEEYMLFKLLSKGTKELFNINRLEEESDEEVIELEFQRAVEKLDQHRVHCPNCNSCITKVVLRKRKSTCVQRETLDLFGCLKCLSIFIPTGNGFNPFGIFGRRNGGVIGDEGTKVIQQQGETDASISITLGETTLGAITNLEDDVTSNLEEESGEPKGSKTLEILKSIVYGGLMESITSLGVVSSAAAADATTVNIVAMGLANLIGGLFIIGPNLRELKNGQVDRYEELLGQRKNFLLHSTVVVLSFLIFGLIPPATYGFSFRQSDDKDLKLVAVAVASLLCIALLAIGKAYLQNSQFHTYIKTVLYYVIKAVMVSGVSYLVGNLIKRFMEKLGLFDPSVDVTISLPQVRSINPTWGSY